MLKLIGAVTVGLITMSAAAFFMLRSKDQRGSDLGTAKSVIAQAVTNMKVYFGALLNSAPEPIPTTTAEAL